MSIRNRPPKFQCKGPVTLLRIVLTYASAGRYEKYHTYTPTYARGTLGIGCTYVAYGESETFLNMLKNFVRIRTYTLVF
jgi:hypothetical protein